MTALKDKFACLTNLPSMPALLMEALQQINGKPHLTTLADKISQDPAITVRILRIANSPFYGMSREIGSLREAILLLGLNRIRDMLVSVCFSTMFPARHQGFNYRRFWHHSMAVAECSRQLAHHTGISPDHAFTAGLLHDIGRLVIVVLFPDEYSRIMDESDLPNAAIERRVLGFDNAEMGGKAAQYWNLPLAIQKAIEQHETPPQQDADKSLGLLIYAANLLNLEADQTGASYALEAHSPLRSAIAILDVSIELAADCAERGLQFADQVVNLS